MRDIVGKLAHVSKCAAALVELTRRLSRPIASLGLLAHTCWSLFMITSRINSKPRQPLMLKKLFRAVQAEHGAVETSPCRYLIAELGQFRHNSVH